jgi:hypothetical protein
MLPKDPTKHKAYIENQRNKHIGKKRTEEQKKKISERVTGEGNPFYGKHHLDETKKLLSEKTKEQWLDPKSRKKVLEANQTKIIPIESRKRMGGIKRYTRKGQHHSEKTKEQLRIINQGKKRSLESRNKQSVTMKERFLNDHILIGQWSERNKLDKNPRWKGGSSFFPYCPKFNNKFKENVRNRFHGECQFPGCEKTKEELGQKRKHSIHHVFAEKMTCCEGNIKEMDLVRKRLPKTVAHFGEPNFTEEEIMYIRMMVPLCDKHHSMVTHESNDLPYEDTVYRKYFAELIMREYDGKCWD